MSLYRKNKEHRLTVIRSTEIGSLCNIINVASWVFLIASFSTIFFLNSFLLVLSQLSIAIMMFLIARVVRLHLILSEESEKVTHHNAGCYREKYTFYFSGIFTCVFGNPFMYNVKAEQNLGDDFFGLIFLISCTLFFILGIYRLFEKLEFNS